MKMSTDIPARRDGILTATVPATEAAPAATYRFVPDSTGQLVAEVESDDHVIFLLETGNFFPVEEEQEAAIDPAMLPLVPVPTSEPEPEPVTPPANSGKKKAGHRG